MILRQVSVVVWSTVPYAEPAGRPLRSRAMDVTVSALLSTDAEDPVRISLPRVEAEAAEGEELVRRTRILMAEEFRRGIARQRLDWRLPPGTFRTRR